MTDPFGRRAPFGGVPGTGEDADRYALWDGAYVLGSLSGDERREYEAHLAVCGSCRSAVGGLSGMPALLAMLGPEEVRAIDDGGPEPPAIGPQLLDTLMAEVYRRRRRSRWMTWTVAAAAAVVLTVGVLVVIRPATVVPTQPAAPQSSVAAMSMTPVVPSELAATVSLSSRGWGTHVEMTCTYHGDAGNGADHGPGDKLAMYAVGRDGRRVQLATWMAVEGATATPTGSTSMPMRDIAAVQVVEADTGEVLLQRSL